MKKGYKVSGVNREKKIGIAAESLAELIKKSCQKLELKVSCAECRICVAEDGTQVDDEDYFRTLIPQTHLIILKKNDEMSTDFDFYYNMIRSTNADYIETGLAVQEFLNTNLKEKLDVFQKYITQAKDTHTMLSERSQDPAWFAVTTLNLARMQINIFYINKKDLELENHPLKGRIGNESLYEDSIIFAGLDPSEKTKEQSMSKRVKERMKGYFYKTKKVLTSSEYYIKSKNGCGKVVIDQFLSDLSQLLKHKNYNGSYFNRKAPKNTRLCNEVGLFKCGGLWDLEYCSYNDEHVINPYRSREERIIFQTWNFDHKIELSRSIIPKILEAVQRVCTGDKCLRCRKNVSWGVELDTYYLNIFSYENIKLVHIVCHDKKAHGAQARIHIICKKCSVNQIDSLTSTAFC